MVHRDRPSVASTRNDQISNIAPFGDLLSGQHKVAMVHRHIDLKTVTVVTIERWSITMEHRQSHRAALKQVDRDMERFLKFT